MYISPLVGCVTPLTIHSFPTRRSSDLSYCVIAWPSGSLAVNSDEAAKTCPRLAVMLDRKSVAKGERSTVCALTVKLGDHALHCVPSLARTHKVSTPLPLW